ncbi:MAG: ABC transporter permease [Neomegalonema sp.]|nr:ABC transporter permease [Neomegalonema sp.]
MSGLFKSYGRPLALFFGLMVSIWAAVLIVLPQFTMVDKALRPPARERDSAVVATLMRDARTCQSVLQTHIDASAAAKTAEPVENGGLAVPSMGGSRPSAGGLPSPSIGGMRAPSPSGGAARPYILQCDRTTTAVKLVRDTDAPTETLSSRYGLPTLSVDPKAAMKAQIAQAQAVYAAAAPLHKRLLAAESGAFPYASRNFELIWAARVIPMSAETKAKEDAEIGNQLLDLLGLRFEKDGVVHLRITLVTLLRTILFALAATTLALLICYPVAYKLAFAPPGGKAIALLLALIIPYAIVEIMRVYAWVSIIEARGVINQALHWIGAIDLDKGEAIPFKRSPMTVFLVIVYTYMLYMVFPIASVMSTLDRNQLEASRDLGASTWRMHSRVVIPHAKPGIAVACISTFMLAAGAFSVPRIISRGLQSEWFSQTIYNKFFEAENSNVGAAYSFAFTVVCFLMVGLFMWLMRARLKDFVRT